MGEDADACLSALKKAKKKLREEGVIAFLDEEDKRLIVPVLGKNLELIYNAVCVDNKIRVISIIKGVGEILNKLSENARLELLMKLLLIPADLKVAVSIDRDGDLIFEPWSSAINEVSWEEIYDSFALSIIFAKWLSDQLKNAKEGKPIEEFVPKKKH